MSQNGDDFQPKQRFGKQKSGGGFGKKFEGDRGRSGGGSFKPRRSFGEDKGERGGEKPFRKPYGDKPRGDKPFGDKPFRKSFDKPRGDKPFGDKPFRKSFDKPYGDKPRGNKPYGDKPFRKSFDKPYGERKERSFGDKPFRKSYDDKPRGDKPYGDKPFRKSFDKPYGERKERSFGDKPFRKSYDDKPRGDKPYGDKPFRKPYGDKPRGDKPFGDKKFGDDRKGGERGSFRPRERDQSSRLDRPRTHQRYEDRAEPKSAEPASFETRQRLKAERASHGAPSSAFLFGVHAVSQALLNAKRSHQRLLVTQSGFESIREAYQSAMDGGLKLPSISYVDNEDIERLLPRDAVHQGILLDCQPLEDVFLADILIAAGDDAKVLVLDQVTDPHNVGAILRSAAAFGAAAIVMQKLHAPEITGTVAKSASGAADVVPIVREVNLSRALEQLKEAGFTCIGLDEEGKKSLSETGASGKVALVLGAEGSGLRRLVAENCDVLARLPTGGPIGSLNVSNAAAVALYELVRKTG